jgi:major membrane immunogen (membrane-anchored lipoprotein)
MIARIVLTFSLLVLILLLGSCGADDKLDSTAAPDGTLLPTAAVAAEQGLAERLGISIEESTAVWPEEKTGG